MKLNLPSQFAQWAYQLRSNLMHRGKSASREGDLVRNALADLHDVLRVYLRSKVPALGDTWRDVEPDGEPYEWRVKKQMVEQR